MPGKGRELEAFLAVPEGHPLPGPAILLVHEIFGPDAHILDVGRRFAAEGFATVAPNLFTGELGRILTPANIGLAMQAFASAPPDLRRDPSKFAPFAASQSPERRPILEAFGRVMSPPAQAAFAQDLLSVARHMRTLSPVDPRRTAALGFCFGGGMVARLATLDPELRAAVIFYGQNPALEEVPRIHASLLGLYGGEDSGITSQVPLLSEAMAKAGKSFTSHVFPGAKHAFFNDSRPQTDHPESARDAWQRSLLFLREKLAL